MPDSEQTENEIIEISSDQVLDVGLEIQLVMTQATLSEMS